MRVATIRTGGAERLALVDADGSGLTLPELGRPGPVGMLDLLRDGPEAWAELAAGGRAGKRLPRGEAELLAPLPRPENNLFALGLNYTDHGEEAYRAAGREYRRPRHPVVFTKDRRSVAAPVGPVAVDFSLSRDIDWEVELAVVIGRRAWRVGETEALDHVFGYCVANDITARDLQTRHKQYYLSKSLPASCPLGPWITTADEVPDPHDLAITLSVNGVPRQVSRTDRMVFSIPETIAAISRVVPLEPGDVILTGTPAGTGFAA
ncbi:fumarylacetoacetate hydrolase family protein, partial [Kitasatospora sp. NPDC056531]|uniref:fumarylacetoacetate hydrolase family protein n=1 Tax=Kitasatospora sp. NPDC056531 TaxID=3345856 RepID=UPI0036CE2B8D